MLINVLIDIANSMFKFFDFSANASVEARLRCSTLRVRVFVSLKLMKKRGVVEESVRF